MATGERPEIIDYPKIYKTWEGKIEVDGKKRVFWIQDLTEEFFDEVIHMYSTGFLVDEPICNSLGAVDDKQCVEEFSELWKQLLKHKLSLICLTKDDTGKVKVCGVNCLYTVHRDDPKQIYKSDIAITVCNFLEYLVKQRDPFSVFGFDKYLSAFGLYVVPEYRGEGIGEEILNVRIIVGRNQGLKGSLTCFSSIPAQKQAKRAGFKDYVVVEYEKIGKEKPEFDFKGIHEQSKLSKLMYMLY